VCDGVTVALGVPDFDGVPETVLENEPVGVTDEVLVDDIVVEGVSDDVGVGVNDAIGE
jgi:hypothetical protein